MRSLGVGRRPRRFGYRGRSRGGAACGRGRAIATPASWHRQQRLRIRGERPRRNGAARDRRVHPILQIVDNLHLPALNTQHAEIVRPPRAAGLRRARRHAASPRPAPPRDGADDDRARPVELAARARAEGARADDPRRRPCRPAASSRSVGRRAPRRLARSGPRGVPRAGGVGSGPAREEPRRVRAPGERRRGRRDLRGARGARRVRRPPRRADRDRRGRPRPARSCRTDGARGGARRRRRLRGGESRLPRPARAARRQREAARDLPAARERAAPLPPGDARRRPARCPCRRASTARSSTGSRPARPPPPAARCSTT